MKLILRKEHLPLADIVAMINSQSEELMEIDLFENNLTDQGLSVILPLLNRFQNLYRLAIGGNRITNHGVQFLLEYWDNLVVTDLDISCNRISDQGAQLLFEKLKTTAKIKRLNISANNVNPDPFTISLVQFIQVNSSLEVLNIGSLELGHSNFLKILSALEKNSFIKELNCINNKLNDQSVTCLAAFLKNLPNKITKIDLRSNDITSVGGQTLQLALKENIHIDSCLLAQNTVADQAKVAIQGTIEKYQKNTSLLKIILIADGFYKNAFTLPIDVLKLICAYVATNINHAPELTNAVFKNSSQLNQWIKTKTPFVTISKKNLCYFFQEKSTINSNQPATENALTYL